MLLFYPAAYKHLHVNHQEKILSCSFFIFFVGKLSRQEMKTLKFLLFILIVYSVKTRFTSGQNHLVVSVQPV